MLLVACVVLWAARAIMGAFGVGDPFNTVVMVVLTLIILVWFLQYLGVAHLGMIPR
jgi:hypothetical protein